MRRAWLPAVAIIAVAASPARADETCQRDPDPVCMADWAVTLASKGTTDAFRRDAIRVRLRLDRVAEAQRMLGDPAAHSADPSAGEIAARTGNPFLAQRILREARAQLEGMPASGTLFSRYRELAEAHRRGGDPDQGRATLQRAADRIREAIRTGYAEGARELALTGAAMLRAGDRAAATAAAAAAENAAPLDEHAVEGDDERLVELFRALRTYEVIARLRKSLGQSEDLGRRLAALAPKVAAAAKDGTSRRIAVAGLVLAHVAMAEANLGNRAAAQRALVLAQDLRARVTGNEARLIDLGLIPAHVALGAWEAADKAAEAIPEAEHRSGSMWRFIAAEQARRGALKESVATALRVPLEYRAMALSEAALAATEER